MGWTRKPHRLEQMCALCTSEARRLRGASRRGAPLPSPATLRAARRAADADPAVPWPCGGGSRGLASSRGRIARASAGAGRGPLALCAAWITRDLTDGAGWRSRMGCKTTSGWETQGVLCLPERPSCVRNASPARCFPENKLAALISPKQIGRALYSPTLAGTRRRARYSRYGLLLLLLLLLLLDFAAAVFAARVPELPSASSLFSASSASAGFAASASIAQAASSSGKRRS